MYLIMIILAAIIAAAIVSFLIKEKKEKQRAEESPLGPPIEVPGNASRMADEYKEWLEGKKDE